MLRERRGAASRLRSRHCHPAGLQRGVAILAMLIAIALFGVVAYTVLSIDASNAAARDARTQAALSEAKQALIAWSATYMATHPPSSSTADALQPVLGLLPCPDQGPSAWGGVGREGVATGSCDNAGVTQLGRLPWSTLAVTPLRDGDGECLWYVVSGSFKNSPKRPMVNRDTPGLIDVVAPDGTGVADRGLDRAAAVVIAPGSVVGAQVRGAADATQVPQCGGNYTAANYLEAREVQGEGSPVDNGVVSTVANAITKLVRGDRTATFNDRVMVITVRELYDGIERQAGLSTLLSDLARRTAWCIARYPVVGSPPGSSEPRVPWPTYVVDGATYPTGETTLPSVSTDDAIGRVFGRVPSALTYSDGDTGRTAGSLPGLVGSQANATGRCPDAIDANGWRPMDTALFANWRDHLFYAIAQGYRPDASSPSCVPGCLTVNGMSNVVAVVFYAGPATADQSSPTRTLAPGYNPSRSRETPEGRGRIENWLEASNATIASGVTLPSPAVPVGVGSYTVVSAPRANGDDVGWCVRLASGSPPLRVYAC
jgi:Tfp pilus assembly protein PilV